MTVCVRSLRVSVRPMISGSAPKRWVHIVWPRSTTAAPGMSSPEAKARPMSGLMPRNWKKFHDVSPTLTRSGASPP